MHFTLLRGGENAIKRSLPATKLCFADCLKVLNILACEGCRWVLLVNLATPRTAVNTWEAHQEFAMENI
jgi:hypothetical protein